MQLQITVTGKEKYNQPTIHRVFSDVENHIAPLISHPRIQTRALPSLQREGQGEVNIEGGNDSFTYRGATETGS
jgi:hypothetical protein